jgi:hypothetical protein
MDKLVELARILGLSPQIRDDRVPLITGARAYVKPAFGRLHVIMRPAASPPIEAIKRPRIASTKSRVVTDVIVVVRPPAGTPEGRAFRDLLGL